MKKLKNTASVKPIFWLISAFYLTFTFVLNVQASFCQTPQCGIGEYLLWLITAAPLSLIDMLLAWTGISTSITAIHGGLYFVLSTTLLFLNFGLLFSLLKKKSWWALIIPSSHIALFRFIGLDIRNIFTELPVLSSIAATIIIAIDLWIFISLWRSNKLNLAEFAEKEQETPEQKQE